MSVGVCVGEQWGGIYVCGRLVKCAGSVGAGPRRGRGPVSRGGCGLGLKSGGLAFRLALEQLRVRGTGTFCT